MALSMSHDRHENSGNSNKAVAKANKCRTVCKSM